MLFLVTAIIVALACFLDFSLASVQAESSTNNGSDEIIHNKEITLVAVLKYVGRLFYLVNPFEYMFPNHDISMVSAIRL